jgi:hypothetical protein
MTIEIIHAERVVIGIDGDSTLTLWHCELEITQSAQTFALPATAPGNLLESDLQSRFEAKEDQLWILAQSKQYPTNLYERLPSRRVLKAFVLVVLDEINILRQQHSLPDRTESQIIEAIKIKLRN